MFSAILSRLIRLWCSRRSVFFCCAAAQDLRLVFALPRGDALAHVARFVIVLIVCVPAFFAHFKTMGREGFAATPVYKPPYNLQGEKMLHMRNPSSGFSWKSSKR